MTRPPYKPFHDGPPRFQVALRQIAPERWLSPDPDAHWLPEKNLRLDTDPALYYRGLPEAAPAEAETLRRVAEATGQPAPDRDEPDLIRAGRLVSDDLVVMENRGEGWTATALLLTQPTFFSLEDAVDHLFLRVERQTLVRLEDTGAVLFCIRICLDPIAVALAAPEDREAFARNWRAASDDALAYKRWGQFGAHVEAALKALA